jgi:hypothetical protein
MIDEDLQWRALFHAIREEPDGPGFANRVSIRFEALLRGVRLRAERFPEPPPRVQMTRRYVEIDPEILAEKIRKLGGATSTARWLRVAHPSMIRRWRSRGRIQAEILARMDELIAAGVPSLRFQHRAEGRHSGRDKATTTDE